MKKILFLLIISLLLFPSIKIRIVEGFNMPYKNYKELSSKHFTIIFEAEKEFKAKTILKIAESIHNKLYIKFGVDNDLHTYIILLNNNDIANGMATILPSNIIILYDITPDIFLELSLVNFYNWMEELITHEYTHILHLNQTRDLYKAAKDMGFKFVSPNSLLPISSIEGLAVSMESYETPMGRAKSSYMNMILRTAVYKDKLPSIDEISTYANKLQGRIGPYIWGGAFHFYLIKKYSLNSLLQTYLDNSGMFSKFSCCSAPHFTGFLLSCLTLFPINSLFDYNAGETYYTAYNNFLKYIKKKYTKEIISIKNKKTPIKILSNNNFWNIYEINFKDNKIYFSAHSPDYGYGIYFYNLKNKKLKPFIKDRLITSFSFYNNEIYLLDYELKNNSYSYFYLYKYNIKNKRLNKIKNFPHSTYMTISENKLLSLSSTNNIKLIRITSLNNKKTKYIKLKNFSLIYDINLKKDKLYFIGKKINDYIDIYSYDINKKEIQRITKNSALEFSLKIYNNSLYYISDLTGIYNLYKYNINKNKYYKLSNFITGIKRFTIANNNIYTAYYTEEGYKISIIKYNDLKENKINYNSIETNKNFYITDNIKKVKITISPEKNYSYTLNMFSNLIYLPVFGFAPGMFMGSIFLYFSDITLKNSLQFFVTYYYPDNDYTTQIFYNKKFNYFSYSIYGYLLRESSLIINSDDTIISNNYTATFEIDYNKLFTRKNLNLYMGFTFDLYTDTINNTHLKSYKNYLYGGIKFNNEVKYNYSILPEKGWNINLKYTLYHPVFGTYFTANLLNFQIRKNIRGLFNHQVLQLSMSGGINLDKDKYGYFVLSYYLKNYLIQNDFNLTLNYLPKSTIYTKNYLYHKILYNIPIIWIERGIKNMPYFLRNLSINIYNEGLSLYQQNLKEIKPYYIGGGEIIINSYYFYRIPGNLILGTSYLFYNKSKNYYIKINFPF